MLYNMSSTRSQDTRTAIIDAARGLFEARGYFGVGLEEVAKKAGVSRQAIYLHCASTPNSSHQRSDGIACGKRPPPSRHWTRSSR
jgi:hypothetical protein